MRTKQGASEASELMAKRVAYLFNGSVENFLGFGIAMLDWIERSLVLMLFAFPIRRSSRHRVCVCVWCD